MPFLNLDDNYADDRVTWKLSDGAFRLDASAMLYCSRLMTDGLIDMDVIPRLVPKFKQAHVDELVHAGKWIPMTISPGTFEIPEVLKHNRSRDRIAADRERNRKRQEKLRQDRAQKLADAELERLGEPREYHR